MLLIHIFSLSPFHKYLTHDLTFKCINYYQLFKGVYSTSRTHPFTHTFMLGVQYLAPEIEPPTFCVVDDPL